MPTLIRNVVSLAFLNLHLHLHLPPLCLLLILLLLPQAHACSGGSGCVGGLCSGGSCPYSTIANCADVQFVSPTFACSCGNSCNPSPLRCINMAGLPHCNEIPPTSRANGMRCRSCDSLLGCSINAGWSTFPGFKARCEVSLYCNPSPTCSNCLHSLAGQYCQFSRANCFNRGFPQTFLNTYTCNCDSGSAGSICQYSDEITCQGHGVALFSGACTCDDGYAGSNCQFSDVNTCSGLGTALFDGTCDCLPGSYGDDCSLTDAVTCAGRGSAMSYDASVECCCSCYSGFGGDHCEFTDADTCNGGGTANGNPCNCYQGYNGPNCQFSDASTCNGKGSVDNLGVCDCDDTFAGNKCQFSDAGNCNNVGSVNDLGLCECLNGYAGLSCQFNDQLNCGGNGVVDSLGGCVCSGTYAGPSCEFSDIINCSGGGTVDDLGLCTCNPTFAGDVCQYSDASTCLGKGIVSDLGECACHTFFVGDSCEISGYDICNGRGTPNLLGDECECEAGSVGTYCQFQTQECPDGFWGTNCEGTVDACTIGGGGLSLISSECDSSSTYAVSTISRGLSCRKLLDEDPSSFYANLEIDQNPLGPFVVVSLGGVKVHLVVQMNAPAGLYMKDLNFALYNESVEDTELILTGTSSPVAASPRLNSEAAVLGHVEFDFGGVFATHLKVWKDPAFDDNSLSWSHLELGDIHVFTDKCKAGEDSCSSRGVLDSDDFCICFNSVGDLCEDCLPGLAGEFCQFSDLVDCQARGTVTTEGLCENCVAPFFGTYCEYDASVLCSGHGDVIDDGRGCQCEEGYSGLLLQAAGVVTPGCRFSDLLTCVGAGVAKEDGSCICRDGFAGRNCEFSDAITCQGRGNVTTTGASIGTCFNCVPPFNGDKCQFSDVLTCNEHGSVTFEGLCICDPTFTGSGCQYSDLVTCQGRGVVDLNGVCACLPQYSNVTNCAECAVDHYGESCTYCTIEQCGGLTHSLGCTDEGTCDCLTGQYTGDSCELQILPCVQSEWTEWTDCSIICDGEFPGSRSRTRLTEQLPVYGGTPCTPTIEEEVCVIGTTCDQHCTPVHWSQWSCCEEGQGEGVRSRYVNPLASLGCTEAGEEYRSCDLLERCPIDCAYTPWSEWSSCDPECGAGSVRNRTATVGVEAAHGGQDCTLEVFDMFEEEECEFVPCPTDCIAGQWSQWSSCTQTCGGGNSTRTRKNIAETNGGNPCIEGVAETIECNVAPCPIDCVWDEWSEFSLCSTVCGGGISFRRRDRYVQEQFGGFTCIGDSVSVITCNPQPCPIDCEYSSWSPFGPCDVECGVGARVRTRGLLIEPQNNGTICSVRYGDGENARRDSETCDTGIICPQDCELSMWNEWSDCTPENSRSRTKDIQVEGAHGGIACTDVPSRESSYCNYCDPLSQEVSCGNYEEYCDFRTSSCKKCGFSEIGAGPRCEQIYLCDPSGSGEGVVGVNRTDTNSTLSGCSELGLACLPNPDNTAQHYCQKCPTGKLPDEAGLSCVECACDSRFGFCDQADISGGGSCDVVANCTRLDVAGPQCNITCPENCGSCNGGIDGDGTCQGSGLACSSGYYGPYCLQCETSQCNAITGERLDVNLLGLGYDNSLVVIFVILGVVVVIIIIIVFFVVRRIRKTVYENYSLPKEMLWHVDPRRADNEKWEKADGFKRREVKINSKEYLEFLNLFRVQLRGDRIPLKKVWAISNGSLIGNFDTQREIMRARQQADPDLFNAQKWKTSKSEQKVKLRDFTYNELQKKLSGTPWFASDDAIPILPVVHGTDSAIGWKIAQNGFTSLSILDAGYYGTGMYFSTSSVYTVPYFATKKNPVILICFAIPGNTYPVVEHRQDKNSLEGLPLRAGSQSHYVVTTKDGNPIRRRTEQRQRHDELVIGQESQVLPAYLVEVDQQNIAAVVREFQRDVTGPRNDEESVDDSMWAGDSESLNLHSPRSEGGGGSEEVLLSAVHLGNSGGKKSKGKKEPKKKEADNEVEMGRLDVAYQKAEGGVEERIVNSSSSSSIVNYSFDTLESRDSGSDDLASPPPLSGAGALSDDSSSSASASFLSEDSD